MFFSYICFITNNNCLIFALIMTITDKIKIDYAVLRPEEQIPAHAQDTWELTYVITGRGMRTIGDTTEPFSEGEVILVPPGMNHHWLFDSCHTDQDGNIADAALFIAPDLFDELILYLPEFADTIKAITCREVAVKFEGTRKKLLQKLLLKLIKTETAEMKVIHFLSLLPLLGAGENDASVVGNKTKSSPTKQKIEKVRIYCECNYMKRITLRSASLHVGMNVTSYCKFFLRNFGCSFTKYINRLRINESCRLLKATSDSVTEIAYSTGFTSVPYFNRIFRNQQGCTPSQYRSSL